MEKKEYALVRVAKFKEWKKVVDEYGLDEMLNHFTNEFPQCTLYDISEDWIEEGGKNRVVKCRFKGYKQDLILELV